MKMEYVREIENMNEDTFNPERIEEMTLSRIKKGHKRSGRVIILAAALTAVLGACAFGVAGGWNAELGDMLGLNDYAQELEGGYVELGLSQESDGVEVTLSKSIGDGSSQWIQLDTNLDYPEQGYYIFHEDEYDIEYKGKIVTGGFSSESFNNDGKLSYMLYYQGCENLNQADMKLKLWKLEYYDSYEADSPSREYNASFDFSWKNNYRDNTRTVKPFRVVKLEDSNGKFSCLISRIEVSPVTIAVKGRIISGGHDVEDGTRHIYVDAVRLKDGSEIKNDKRNYTSAEIQSGGKTKLYLSLSREYIDEEPEHMLVNGNEIEAVIIGNKEFKIK